MRAYDALFETFVLLLFKHVWFGRKEKKIEENTEKYIVTNIYFKTP